MVAKKPYLAWDGLFNSLRDGSTSWFIRWQDAYCRACGVSDGFQRLREYTSAEAGIKWNFKYPIYTHHTHDVPPHPHMFNNGPTSRQIPSTCLPEICYSMIFYFAYVLNTSKYFSEVDMEQEIVPKEAPGLTYGRLFRWEATTCILGDRRCGREGDNHSIVLHGKSPITPQIKSKRPTRILGYCHLTKTCSRNVRRSQIPGYSNSLCP